MSEGIIVALIGSVTSLITLIVSSINNHKLKKQEKLKEEIHKEIQTSRDESKAEIKDLKNIINGNRRKTLKNILVNEFTELIKGKEKSKEQLQDIAEMFEEYKSLGGNSYIDDLHDIWKAKQIKK
jgi:tyrosyl-tRNA synthetase